MTDVTIPFVGALQFPNAGGVLTVIWLVALMNVVNFSDGVDGLAAGLCAIDGIAFSVIAFDLDVSGAAVLAALTAGAALGFLFHNFYPASVFMGDAGANLLGYLLGRRRGRRLAEDQRRRRAGGAVRDPRRARPRHRRSSSPSASSTGASRGRPTPTTSTTGWPGSASPSARPSPTCTRGRCCWRGWRWRCGCCRSIRTTRTTPRSGSPCWCVLALVAFAVSVYLVFVLEIFKFPGQPRVEPTAGGRRTENRGRGRPRPAGPRHFRAATDRGPRSVSLAATARGPRPAMGRRSRQATARRRLRDGIAAARDEDPGRLPQRVTRPRATSRPASSHG